MSDEMQNSTTSTHQLIRQLRQLGDVRAPDTILSTVLARLGLNTAAKAKPEAGYTTGLPVAATAVNYAPSRSEASRRESGKEKAEAGYTPGSPVATAPVGYAPSRPEFLLKLRKMSLEALVEHFIREIDRYRRGEGHDDSYCLEVFRRAMLQHDEQAWAVLHQRFHETILNWLRRHPGGELACQLEGEEYFVGRTFQRFWQATAYNQRLEFTTLGAALYYLKTSLNGEIMDVLRAHKRAREVPLPDEGFSEHFQWQEDNSVEPLENEPDESSELWEAIESLLPGERERRVAYLLYHCNLKPREIVRYVPEEFNNVQEVYRLSRNIYDCLMRNRDLLRWRLSG